MKKIKEIINSNFSFLFDEYGFNFVEKKEYFENFIVEVKRDNIFFRFIEDRNDFFLDFTFDNSEWINIYCVLDWLKIKNQILSKIKPVNKVKNIKRILRQYIKIILDFIDEEKFDELKNYCKQ